MADHNAPTVSTAYATFLPNISDRIKDAMLGNDPANVTVTNPPTNSIRWNSASFKWQKWSGAAWADLTATYAIAISGNAATASVATAVAWSGITSKPTTLAGFGITDAAPLASPLLTGTPKHNGIEIGYRVIPSVGNTATAAVTERGKVYKNTGGITVPASVFAADDTFSIYNNSAVAITITQGASLTLRQVGTANTGNRTLAQRGFATVFFISATEAVISGGGLS